MLRLGLLRAAPSRLRRAPKSGECSAFAILFDNLAGRQIALVVLSKAQWPYVKKHLFEIAEAVNAANPGSYLEVEIRESGPTV